MPLVQRYNNSNTTYSGFDYQFAVSNAAHNLYVAGSNSRTTIYPLTSDTSASQYCKFKVRVGGKDCYLAKQFQTVTGTIDWIITATSTYWTNSEYYEIITTTKSNTFLSTISGGTNTYDASGDTGTKFTSSQMTRDSIQNISTVAYGSYQSIRTDFAGAYATDQTWWKIFSHEASQRFPLGGTAKKYAGSKGTTLQDANAKAIATVASNGTSSGFTYESTFTYAGGLPTESSKMRSAKNTTRAYTLSGYETQGMTQVTTMKAADARTSFPIINGATTTYVWNATQQKTTNQLTIPVVRGIALSTSASYSLSITASTAANYPNRASRSMTVSRISYKASTRWGQRQHTVLSSATGTSKEEYIEEWMEESVITALATNLNNLNNISVLSNNGFFVQTTIQSSDITDYRSEPGTLAYTTTNNAWTT